jgi:hypothetical protein
MINEVNIQDLKIPSELFFSEGASSSAVVKACVPVFPHSVSLEYCKEQSVCSWWNVNSGCEGVFSPLLNVIYREETKFWSDLAARKI